MITLAQRIEELRTQRGMSRPGLSAALGLPKNAIEKFETGRQTPNQEQQEKLAAYFGVSIFYLRGESDDRTRQESWLEGAYQEDPVQSPLPGGSLGVPPSLWEERELCSIPSCEVLPFRSWCGRWY